MIVFRLKIELIKSYPLVTHWLPTELPTYVQKRADLRKTGNPMSTPSILEVVAFGTSSSVLVYNFNGKLIEREREREEERGVKRIGSSVDLVPGNGDVVLFEGIFPTLPATA
jgi:hypothetical protein